MSSRALGARGERFAARYLRRAGYRILGRNVDVGRYEADLVVRAPDGDTVVVVEVKTRRADVPPAEASVGVAKGRRLAALAESIQQQTRFSSGGVRVDVIAITWPRRRWRPSEVRHYVDAIEAWPD